MQVPGEFIPRDQLPPQVSPEFKLIAAAEQRMSDLDELIRDVEKNRDSLRFWKGLSDIGARQNQKALDAWVETGPLSRNVEDRRSNDYTEPQRKVYTIDEAIAEQKKKRSR